VTGSQRFFSQLPFIFPLIRKLFEMIRNHPTKAEFTISCSYLEIYQEKITDLLNMDKRDLQVWLSN
jgi:hypothetical protein